jgi:cysteinyl-tRNA synthetase
MKLYNTLTSQLEELQPVVPGRISMYVCGPTVYSYIHIGNARPLIVFDVVRRYFEYRGFHVHYVMNITDINDKIIEQAKKEHTTEHHIAQRYTMSFIEDYQKLQCLPPNKFVKVTESMDSIVHYIERLLDKGFAYQVDQDVFFRVHRIEEYGRLSGQVKDDLISGSRVDVDARKESPLDFVIWKSGSDGTPLESPFGPGRPGWHTECSCMIEDEFDSIIDIHGGGADLRFPHHENEMAQSLALNNHTLANVWMHNARIDMGDEKMSKSLGNIVLVKDLLQDYNANALRLFVLSVHYRTPLSFRFEQVEFYKSEWEKIERAVVQLHVELDLHEAFGPAADDTWLSHLTKSMDQDFNTANVLTDLYAIIKQVNIAVRSKDLKAMTSLYNTVLIYANVLGLRFELPRLSAKDRSMYHDWLDARANKDFDRADTIRNQLMERGILM